MIDWFVALVMMVLTVVAMFMGIWGTVLIVGLTVEAVSICWAAMWRKGDKR